MAICVAATGVDSIRIVVARRDIRESRRRLMKMTYVLGLAAVGAVLVLAAPTERAYAVSLASPGAAATVQQDTKSPTTEVRWWRHRHHGGWHRRHR
jgi:hypothetical protein